MKRILECFVSFDEIETGSHRNDRVCWVRIVRLVEIVGLSVGSIETPHGFEDDAVSA
jgi:hypothetical protein